MNDANPNQPSEQTVQSETRRFWKKILLGGLVVLCLLGFVVWISLSHEVPLEISPETTVITEPLTTDGKQVDYFRAIELESYPPNMKTDENGYRMMVRAFGVEPNCYTPSGERQVYEKLGLDPSIKPTLTLQGLENPVEEYFQLHPDLQKENKKLDTWHFESQIEQPWTLEALPMMGDWLATNGPALDLASKALKQPVFCIPQARESEKDCYIPYRFLKLDRLKMLGEAFRWRANYRIGTGNLDGAIDDLIACDILGRHLGHTGCQKGIVCGNYFDLLSGHIAIAGSLEHQPTKAELLRLLNTLIDLSSKNLPAQVELKARDHHQQYSCLDAIQKLAFGSHEEKSAVFQDLEIERLMPLDSSVRLASAGHDWNQIAKRVNEYFNDSDCYVFASRRDANPFLFLFSDAAQSKFLADLLYSICRHPNVYYADTWTDSAERIRIISIAMLIYEKEHGHLPPVWTVDKQGKPLHSWHVLLLPYLGDKAVELYSKIRLDEPWDSEHNRQFHNADIPFYQHSGSEPKPGETPYTVVIGEKTAFQGEKGKTLEELGPNREDTVLVFEHRSSTCWMDPSSSVGQPPDGESVGSRYMDDGSIGFLDGHIGGYSNK